MSTQAAFAPLTPAPVAFAALATPRLARMAEAGQRLIAMARILAKTGDSIVGEVTRGCGPLHPYAHYPAGDVVDSESGARFYYHLHPVPPLGAAAAEGSGGLHAHFHCFAPAPEPSLPKSSLPEPTLPEPSLPEPSLPEPSPPDLSSSGGLGRRRRGSGMAHLVAVEVDRHAMPVRLFTTNRWVTDETWVEARAAARLADRFVVEVARPSLPAAIWISSVVRLFQPQIAGLLAARDAAIATLAGLLPEADPFEDLRLEVPSALAISVEAQMAELRAALILRQGGAAGG